MAWGAIPLGLWLAAVSHSAAASGWRCAAKPVEPCFRHHGRLSSQNGIALKIWLIGTTRMVGLDSTELPEVVEKYMDMTSPSHSYVYGDFDICPLEPDTPGHLRRVCVVAAERLVVQDVERLRPPFRLLDTWTAKPDGKDGSSGLVGIGAIPEPSEPIVRQ
jgi:hypothetical protein